jgi:hypothetical protein
MSKPINLVVDALQYLDTNMEKYDSMFQNIAFLKFIKSDNDMDHSIVYMYDTNKKEIMKSKYEVIGVFNNFAKTWSWAWSMPQLFKNMASLSRKLLNYGLDLDPRTKFLKTELITSRFRITNNVQLDLHVALASYISKSPVVYKFISYPDVLLTSENMVEVQSSDDPTYSAYYLFILDY